MFHKSAVCNWIYGLIVVVLLCFYGCADAEGDRANTSSDPCQGVTCSDHGDCAVRGDGTAMCLCEEGYHDEELECVDDKAGLACDLDELETFNAEIPTGWTVVDGGSGAGTWEWSDTIPFTVPDPIYVKADGGAIINSQLYGTNASQNDDLVTPVFDLGGCSSAALTFDYNFQKRATGLDDGEVYIIPGGNGDPILALNYDESSPVDSMQAVSIPVTAAMLKEESTFSVVFHYEGANDFGWYIDNVRVTGVP